MLFICPSCAPKSDRPAAPPSADVLAVAEDNNRFALDLYARLRNGQSDNLFFSPGSLSTALAMTYAGARGQTAEQMAQVLHVRLPQEKLHPAFGHLPRYWGVGGKGRGYRLSMANRLWGQQGFHFLPGFLSTTRDLYGAELAQVDFAGKTEQARRRINAWVEEQTQGKIRDLIPPGVLDARTRLVLTNAIYFKGDWTEPFRKEITQAAPFHISAQQQTDVPLMYQQDDFRYWAGDGLKLLELPYGKGDLAMLVLLPDEIEGLSALEAKLTTDNVSRWQSGLRKQEVRVYLPRFRLTSQFQLAEVLKAMGMTRPFTPGEADLSGMSSEQELVVSAVIHKAFVDVNEEGTEAAAATGVEVKTTAAILGPAVFRADHPFVFLIRDNRTGVILFLGRLVNPGG
jgi:serpin B